MTTRRDFLKALFSAAGICVADQLLSSQSVLAAIARSKTRTLNLNNVHTGEHLNLRYGAKGIWRDDDLEKISYLLRCHYTNEIKPIDPDVINLLCRIKDRFGSSKQVKIISGYRSRRYNEYLRCSGHCVAKESLHLKGLAVDFSIPGARTRDISRASKRLAAGGVGKYPDFVHIDTGRVRCWQG
jgi:uncharacterized protein YcbK (DUF882 family)